MKKVREEFGLVNVIPMVPFCRTLDEGRKVVEIMAQNGLKQGENGLKVYVMCEIPANVILAEKFLEIFQHVCLFEGIQMFIKLRKQFNFVALEALFGIHFAQKGIESSSKIPSFPCPCRCSCACPFSSCGLPRKRTVSAMIS